MKNNHKLLLFMYFILILIPSNNSRGGRSRGGGGIFGNWRKGKKSVTTLYGRSKSDQYFKPYSQVNNKVYSPFLNWQFYDTQSHPNMHLSTDIRYFKNVPKGAVYYPYSSPFAANWVLSDFHLWYITGKLLTGRQQEEQVKYASKLAIDETENSKIPMKYWPTDSLIPLSPVNESMLSNASQTSVETPIFQSSPNSTIISNQTNMPEKVENQQPSNGFICMPMMINETSTLNINKQLEVKKLVCFPALSAIQNSCVMRTFIQTDPNDAQKTIEVVRPLCSKPKKASMEPVIGDIIDTNDGN